MALTLVTPPDPDDPVLTLAEAKAHARVDTAEDDALIAALVAAAVGHVEGRDGWLGRCLVTQTWRWDLDGWPCDGLFRLPLAPVQAVSGISYLDAAGATQTLDPALYHVDVASVPARIVPRAGVSLPVLVEGMPNRVSVSFVAGYGAAVTVPRPIRQALLLLVGHWYENREAVVTGSGTTVTTLPMAVEALLMPHRVWWF